MRALVVYESMFGNTKKIAEAVAEGLAQHMVVETEEVGHVGAIPEDTGLVVVGGPTHAFGMSRESTRRDAANQAGGTVVSQGIGMREWLDAVRADGIPSASFDTRVDHPRLTGSAARAASRRLRRDGFRQVAPATSFYVTGTTGPLVDGETIRARQWGERLARSVTSR